MMAVYCKRKRHGVKFVSPWQSYQCSEKRTENRPLPQQKVFTSRIYKAYLAVKENYQWKEIHFKTYQYLFYFSGNNFILFFRFLLLQEKGTL